MDFDNVPYEDIVWGEKVGGGSFGTVYKGQYLGLDIAIKEIHPSSSYPMAKYFEREWRIMRECRHPNIVLFLGLCKEPHGEGRVFIVSEYVAGGSLRSHLRSSRYISWQTRLRFIMDAAKAVAYLHARQCLHRDLKSENLLLTADNHVKVADFGFARITGRNAEEMRHMTYCGTDGYMSPEVNMGESFDLPTDVYSLGIILLETLTRALVGSKTWARGAPTFVPDTAEVWRRASPGCPPALVELALDCCKFDPGERPVMREVLERLEVIQALLPEHEGEGDGLGSGSTGVGVGGGVGVGMPRVGQGKRAMPVFKALDPNVLDKAPRRVSTLKAVAKQATSHSCVRSPRSPRNSTVVLFDYSSVGSASSAVEDIVGGQDFGSDEEDDKAVQALANAHVEISDSLFPLSRLSDFSDQSQVSDSWRTAVWTDPNSKCNTSTAHFGCLICASIELYNE